MFEIECEVNPDLVSPPYHHVHHADVLRFLERARLAFLREVGFPNDDFLAKGLFLVITGLEVKYKRELLPGLIRVTCERPCIHGKIVTIEQRIINAKGKTAVEARVDSQFLDGVLRRGVSPPQDFAAVFR